MNMREKMARAMSRVGWDKETRPDQIYWLSVADDALKALLEPTPEMISQVDAVLPYAMNRPTDEAFGRVFRAMIQAAKDGK